MDRALTVDIETSGRDDDVSITTNLSSIDSFYTLVQGNRTVCISLRISDLISISYRIKDGVNLMHGLFQCNLTDQLRNSYQVGYDSSLRVIYANGMDSHYQTEPHILAGAANPTVARRNMSLPGENGQNLVEWRFRKEQTRGKVIVFGRKLRVSRPTTAQCIIYSSS